MRTTRWMAAISGAGAVMLVATACGSPAAPTASSSSAAPAASSAAPAASSAAASAAGSAAAGGDAATATSAAALGGLAGLEAACKAEGKLNVIALPPDWANYGAIIDAFKAKYGVEVDSAQPDGSSQDEINAATQLKGTDRAPDVFDVGQSVAVANTAMFAPYQVATWADIADNFKDPTGTWVNDYGGYMAISYDAGKVPAVTSLADLLKPEFKGKVALNGDPTQAGAAWNGVMMASLANGGSLDDISKGVDFFKQLNDAGNFLPVDPTPATVESGQTPVVIDWDYLEAGQAAALKAKGIDWKTVVPDNAVVGGYYYQAINKDAPHPACARLWQEYLYSDDGQNGWLKGGARPVRADAMVAAGTIDKAAYEALPKVNGTPQVPTADQVKAGNDYLAANWAKAIGG
jgi:putative spermidine/putrescine transport system substrate-binding protein